ncbi:E3 ubiquitin-protein ligase tom1 [Coemansia sp. RSA 485]|nr:E3 ubiquitin-protein ligase tom1 [Coemansia sp. RSA 485]
MAEICEKYNLVSFQQTDFDSNTQTLLVAMLNFSRLLMENCINRNLYNSVERLDCLLNTSDLEVLECNLRVLLRAAQRWSYQRDLKTSLTTMSSRLMTITESWHLQTDGASAATTAPTTAAETEAETEAEAQADKPSATGSATSHANEFRVLVSDNIDSIIQKNASFIRFSFFRTSEDARKLEEDAIAASEPGSVAQAGAGSSALAGGARRTQPKKAACHFKEGLVVIDVALESLIKQSDNIDEQMRQAFDALVSRYKVPTVHHYELRHRIQVAATFVVNDASLRFALLRSRIYAAAILSQLMSELEFKNNFLSREPNFTANIISILQPEAHAPLSVQTAVLLALEALLKQRSEVSGAYVALNASANHGVLMFILRKAFSSTGDQPAYPFEFMSALYAFLSAMATNLNGGQLLVSAGVIPIFASALKQTQPKQQRSAGRIAKLLDGLISSTASAFPAFCSANGITALANRIHGEVCAAVSISDANPEAANDLSSPIKPPRLEDITRQLYRRHEILPAEHIYLLKELFKFLSHLLQQPTYHDRLRNLVETDLPSTLRTVITHPAAFGGNIYGSAISISAMLVHNEPTSLPIIQEARLPETMLSCLEKHLPYSGDVIMNIPAALGAFCLNDVGMEQFRKSKIISKVLGAFSDPDFVRVLQEGDVPGSFGAALDEFMRHFPIVKDEIIGDIIAMLQNVVDMGNEGSSLQKLGPGHTFLLRTAQEADIKTHLDDFYGMMLESATTFLEGFLEQRTHSKLFLDKGGWVLVVKAMRSPLLSFDFVKSRTFKSLHGLSSTLLDTSQEMVYQALFRGLKDCLALPQIVSYSPGDHVAGSDSDGISAFLALSDPNSLSPEEFGEVHDRLHNSISTCGIIALIANLIGGASGGALSRSIKDINEVMPCDDFVGVVASVCSLYCTSVKKAVAIEHAISKLPEATDDKKSEEKTGEAVASQSQDKGKQSEMEVSSAQPPSQAMDVDQAPTAIVEPYARANYTSLFDVVVPLTIQSGDLIESFSNSLGLGTRPGRGAGSQTQLGASMSAVLVKFAFSLLDICKHADRTALGGHLIDQVLVIFMKTMVFARHRIYLKLRIFTQFVEKGGLAEYCQLLKDMWDWAASVPEPVPQDDGNKSGGTGSADSSADNKTKSADPGSALRTVLDNALESALSILSFILDGEPVTEASEYASLCQEHELRLCWFRASDIIVEMRLQALPVLQHIWNSRLLFTGNNNLMQAYISCLGPVINARLETRSSSATLGLRTHFSGLASNRRGSQSGANRASGSQTPIPLLGRALGAGGRSSPLTQAPVLPQPSNDESPADEPSADEPSADEQPGDARQDGTRHVEGQADETLGAQQPGTQEHGSDRADADESESSADSDGDSDSDDGEAAASETAAPMSVDSSGSSAAQPNTVDASAEGSASAHVGIEPFNQAAWREAREDEDKARREKLQSLRDQLKNSITPRAIAVVDELKDKAVVHAKNALELVLQKSESLPVTHMLMNAFTPLLDAVDPTEDGSGDVDQRLSAHAYLWAVLLSTPHMLDEMYRYVGPVGSHILRALDVAHQREDRSPHWLTALLLVTELLLQRDIRPSKVKLNTKEEFQRAAKRTLKKLPPSSAPVDASMAPPRQAGASSADAVRQMFSRALMQQLGPQGTLFEPLLFGHDEEDGDDDDSERQADGDGDIDIEVDTNDNADASADTDNGPQAASSAQESEAQSASAEAPSFSSPAAAAATVDPVFSAVQRSELQRLAVKFFEQPVPAFSAPVFNALMRLVVILTRDPQFALEFLDSGSLSNVVRVVRTMSVGEIPSIASTAKEKTPLGFVNALMAVSKEKRQELRQERSLIMHVLRHVVENRPILRLVMENLVQNWFESALYSSADVNTYVRATLSHALRDPELFNQVTVDRSFLSSYNEEMRVSWMALAWRSTKLLDEEEVDRYEASSDDDKEFVEYLAQKKKQPGFVPYEMDPESERLACRVAEFLCEEILSLRPTLASSSSTNALHGHLATPAKPRPVLGAASSGGPAAASISSEDSPDTISYRVFLMQCLSEMIASFPFTLRAIFVSRNSSYTAIQPGLLSPRKDRPKDKGKAVASGQDDPNASSGQSGPPQKIDIRVRSPLISHLVHDLVVREAVTDYRVRRMKNRPKEVEGTELEQVLAIARHQIALKQGQLSQLVTFWATALLSTACVKHQQGWTTTKPKAGAVSDSQTLTLTLESLVGNYESSVFAARHLVLDHIARAFRECLNATSAGVGISGSDVIYARLGSLAQLVHKLVIARPITHGRRGDVNGTDSADSERESSSALRQIILERGVLDLLVASSSRVNLNHPASREILTLFLRPIELLSKAAVKISRDAVLKAWEESGQDKMPSMAMGQQQQQQLRGLGGTDIWDDEVAPEDAEDDDVPPDLYENSALGLYQNQRTAAGHGGNEDYGEEELMDDIFDEEVFDEGNSSASDIDTEEDEQLAEEMLLAGSGGGNGDDMDDSQDGDDDDDNEGGLAMELDDDGDDDTDSDDESDHDSDVDSDSDIGSSGAEEIELTIEEAENLLQAEEDRMMEEDEAAADFYSSDLEGEVVLSNEEDGDNDDNHGGDNGHNSGDSHDDDGWETEMSDVGIDALDVIGQHVRRLGERSQGEIGAGMVINVGSTGERSRAHDRHEADNSHHDDDDDEDEDDDGDSSDSASTDDDIDFVDDFPATLDITMEAIDGHGRPAHLFGEDRPSFLLDALSSRLSGDTNGRLPGVRELRINQIVNVRDNGRPTGALNGIGGRGPGMGIDLQRAQAFGRGGGVLGGIGGPNGNNMTHPLLDRTEPTTGLQARADRVNRGSTTIPVNSSLEDVFGLGQLLVSRLSAALSHGRRPVHTHHLIPGPAAPPAPVSSPSKSRTVHLDGTVSNALSDAGSQASEELAKLLRLSMAAAAIDAYMPMSTVERWQEEARMLFGTQASIFTSHIANRLLNQLIPETIRQSLLRQRYNVELMRRQAEADRQRMEREDAERKEREEAAKAAEEERLRQADAAMALDNADGGNDDPDSGSGSDSNNDDSKSDTSSQSGSGSDGDAAAAQNPEQAPEQGQAPQQESTPEPVFVTINGERMDISDTGIDPEFLDALPDELRMEVIQGRREELRLEQQAAGAGNQTGSTGADAANTGDAGAQGISQEFLDALPPDIREELLEEERLQRQILAHQEMIRQRFGGQSSADAAAGGATRTSASTENVSPVTAAVQDRLSLIVPSGSASSRLFQLRRPSHHAAAAAGAGAGASTSAAAAAASGSGSGNSEDQHRLRDKRRKKIASRDIAVQLLSRSEMAALARFMFLPNHAVSSSLIAKTMQYLCENGRTRSQLIHLMLSILDSNATNLSDVETIIRQTILHGNGSSAVDPPALGTSESSTSATAASGALLLGAPAVAQFTSTLVQQQNTDFSFQLSDLQSDVAAYVPAQRSLDMLHNLAVHNTRASVHFLVEHQQLKSLHSGKQPQQGSEDEENHFPVVHLLRLLEKPLYYSHGSAITELLMQLLSTITKPLAGMVRRNNQQQGSGAASAAVPDVSSANPVTTFVSSASAAGGSSLSFQLPTIPADALRAIVNVLAAGECTSRTFQHTLSLIQNLSCITGVLTVITDELVKRATELSGCVCQEIDMLLSVLNTLPAPKTDQQSQAQTRQRQSTGGDSRTSTPLNTTDEGGSGALVDVPVDVLDKVRDITLSNFSPARSHQARLLRLLMAIDYISTTVTKRLEEKQQQQQQKSKADAASEEQDTMDVDTESPSAAIPVDDAPSAELLHLRSLALGHDAQFLPLWEAASSCLQYTSASPELVHVATVLLPLIESFMVVFKPIVGEKNSRGAADPSTSALHTSNSFQSLQLVTPTAPTSTMTLASGESYFQNFTEKHKKMLNTLVRNNPGLLSGSFSLLVFNPHVLDFDNKRSYFYQRLHDDSSANAASGAGGNAARRQGTRPLGSTLNLHVHRDNVFEDSYYQFVGKSGEEIKRGRINVRFYQEEGVDAGGVSREWFQALARQMFNPDYALFKPSAAGRVTYQPNPQSFANPEHLQYFKFVGRIIGKAIVDQRVLDAYFTRSFYKHILGRKVDYRDMEAIDPSYYKSLEWILENDITDVFDETFSIEVDNFGQRRIIDLIPNGQEIAVTEENKADYVRLVTEQRLYRAIKDQIKAFLEGFHDLIPKDLIQIFNEQELELLISGMPDIDVDDWRNNTEYHGGYSSSSAPVQWFWRAVRSFDQEERAKLLQFVTGTSKVPLEGFAHLQGNQGVQRFQIHKAFGSTTRLPTAHTCFNQLDLPVYDNFETLKSNLLLAISECSTGFGFV